MIQTVDPQGRPCLRVRVGERRWDCFYADEFAVDCRGWHWQLRQGTSRRPFHTRETLSWHLLGSNRTHRGRPTEPLTKLELREIPKPPEGPDPDKYPQHRALWQLQQDGVDTQTIGLFLDTCKYKLGSWICYHCGEVGPGDDCCNASEHRFSQVIIPIEKILAEHYGIDYQALMREKDAMLDGIRAASKAVR